MLHSDGRDKLKTKRICKVCVNEPYLSGEIDRTGNKKECSYCGITTQCWRIEELADQIETAFKHHYTRSPDQPTEWEESLLADKESEYVWYRDGSLVLDAIKAEAKIPSEAAEDVLSILADKHFDFELATMGVESEFSPYSCYEETEPDTMAWHQKWHSFQKSLQKEARFFSHSVSAYLISVFGGIDKLKTMSNRPLVVDAGPQSALNHLYRARVFQDDEKLEEALCRPDLHLGPPPAAHASAGRMNAHGISVFYGATDARVAIAEVRPPVGSKAAIAKFIIIRQLRLLDLTALPEVYDPGSIFDSSLKERLERVKFLKSLGLVITRPIMPNDEPFDYLATQAIADFLATQNEPRLDGIIFQSAQSKEGSNVVLFHKAALVEVAEFPEGTKLETSMGNWTEDGWEINYSVKETVPLPTLSPKGDDEALGPPKLHATWNDDSREATLRVDPMSLEVHHVKWVQVQCTTNKVTRACPHFIFNQISVQAR